MAKDGLVSKATSVAKPKWHSIPQRSSHHMDTVQGRAKMVSADNGNEFAYHLEVGLRLGLTAYLADPFASLLHGSKNNRAGPLQA